MLIDLINLLIAITDFTNFMFRKQSLPCLQDIWGTRVRLKAAIYFNHVERSPSIKSIKSLITMFVN